MREPKHSNDPQTKVQWETRRRINNARFHRKDVRLIALEGDPLSSPLCISQNLLELPTVEKVMLSRDNEDPPGPSVCSLQRLSLGSLAETLLLSYNNFFFFYLFNHLGGETKLKHGNRLWIDAQPHYYSSLCSRENHNVTGDGRLTREIAPSALMV